MSPPGCFGEGRLRFRLKEHGLFEPAEQRGLAVVHDLVGQGMWSDGQHHLVPVTAINDAQPVGAFLEQARAGPVEVIERQPVAMWVDDWEVIVVEDPAQRAWLETIAARNHRPPPTVIDGEKVRLRAGGHEVFDIVATGAPPLDVGALFERTWAMESAIADDPAGAGRLHFWFLGRRHGAPARVRQAVRALGPQVRGALIMPTVALDRAASAGEVAACRAGLQEAGVAAVGVSSRDLRLGPRLLRERSEGLPVLAANLRLPSGEQPFPGYRVLERDGVRLAVIGLVSPRAAARLGRAEREAFVVRPVRATLETLLEELRSTDAPPDVIALLVDPDPDVAWVAGRLYGVDLVLGDLRRADLVARREVMAQGGGGRLVAASQAAITEVELLRPGAPGGARRVRVTSRPVRDVDPADRQFAPVIAERLERRVGSGLVVFPDLGQLVRARPALGDGLTGDRVLTLGGWRPRPASGLYRFSDPLFARLVGNALVEDGGQDAALIRNPQRTINAAGPLIERTVRAWIPATTEVQTLRVSGAQLLVALERVALAHQSASTPPRDLVFGAHLSARPPRVRGRPIDPRARYDVVISLDVLELPTLASALASATRLDTPRSMQEVVIGHLSTLWPQGAPADDADPHALALLEDHASEATGEWQLQLQPVGLRGALIVGTPSLGTYARSRETRATTPNLYQLDIDAHPRLLYDHPWFVWESRVDAQLSTIVLAIAGVPPREVRDDLLVTSELRLAALRRFIPWSLRVEPFARAAVDSEFTPTPDPAMPGASLPHQLLLKQSVGVGLYAPVGLTQLSVAALVQEDVSEMTVAPYQPGLHLDAGLEVHAQVLVDAWRTRLQSDLNLRLLAPDPDDRPEDLLLRTQWVSRLSVARLGPAAAYVFLDVFVVWGKSPSTQPPAASVLTGMGIAFDDVYRLRWP